MTVPISKIARIWAPRRIENGWAVEAFDLVAIDDVGFLRKANAHWSDWAADRSEPQPLFNWVSIYNFGAGLDCEAYALSSGATGQHAEALMLIRYGHVVRCDSALRGPLAYVAFLEVAPWNRQGVPDRRFRGLGSVMLRAAAEFSIQRGFEGRVALHSVAAAQEFYRRIGFRSLDCPNEYNEMYFELVDRGARGLLAE